MKHLIIIFSCIILFTNLSCKKKKQPDPIPPTVIDNPIDTTGNNNPTPEYLIIQVQNILSIQGKLNWVGYSNRGFCIFK
jgi:hypothetical protein